MQIQWDNLVDTTNAKRLSEDADKILGALLEHAKKHDPGLSVLEFHGFLEVRTTSRPFPISWRLE